MVNIPFLTVEQIDEAVDVVRQRTRFQPTIALVLGSGLGALADSVLQPDIIAADDLPHWPKSTVDGHAGRLVIGRFENQVNRAKLRLQFLFKKLNVITVEFVNADRHDAAGDVAAGKPD